MLINWNRWNEITKTHVFLTPSPMLSISFCFLKVLNSASFFRYYINYAEAEAEAESEVNGAQTLREHTNTQ